METLAFTVIGGGICGVLTALKLKTRYPDRDVVLIDKEPYIGHHNTTRNSGVLHAGIYYPNGSLKHKLCIAGYNEWVHLCAKYNIERNICGKYIIATSEPELQTLDEIFLGAQKNGVTGLSKMTSADLAEIQDYSNAIGGFLSAQTGILDISSGINILRDELLKLDVIVMMNTEVIKIKSSGDKILIEYSTEPSSEASTESFQTEHLINCAGADAVNLRRQLGLVDIESLLVKGNYLKLNKPYYNKKLIYPVPEKGLYGLGVHTSFHLDGIVRFGPNTENTNSVSYANSEKNIELMYPAIKQKFKQIEKSDLSPDYTGVRTKILKNGALHSDFLIQNPTETKIAGYHEALGIESPGMTAAPAIANLIVSSIEA